MEYRRSEKYCTPELMAKMMGPNPIKLEEELLEKSGISPDMTVCDLGCGKGLTSVFLAKEYGCRVYATDLWIDAEQNRSFFAQMGLSEEQITSVHADVAEMLPFEKEFFDAVVTVDSYHYFGRDKKFLDEKLLPYVKKGGCIYIAVPGMKKDRHDDLPHELLLSWTAEDMETMHDAAWWTEILSASEDAEVVSIYEMQSNEEVWADWLKQENPYAVGDRKSMHAGAGKYLNFVAMVLRKK